MAGGWGRELDGGGLNALLPRHLPPLDDWLAPRNAFHPLPPPPPLSLSLSLTTCDEKLLHCTLLPPTALLYICTLFLYCTAETLDILPTFAWVTRNVSYDIWAAFLCVLE